VLPPLAPPLADLPPVPPAGVASGSPPSRLPPAPPVWLLVPVLLAPAVAPPWLRLLVLPACALLPPLLPPVVIPASLFTLVDDETAVLPPEAPPLAPAPPLVIPVAPAPPELVLPPNTAPPAVPLVELPALVVELPPTPEGPAASLEQAARANTRVAARPEYSVRKSGHRIGDLQALDRKRADSARKPPMCSRVERKFGGSSACPILRQGSRYEAAHPFDYRDPCPLFWLKDKADNPDRKQPIALRPGGIASSGPILWSCCQQHLRPSKGGAQLGRQLFLHNSRRRPMSVRAG
jgi:hypothetical protein